MIRKILLGLVVVFLSLVSIAYTWDGYDYETGDYIEIEKGNLVRPGRDIEVYDYDDGSYHDVHVESIEENGGSVEIEVYDSESGEYRTFEMEEE